MTLKKYRVALSYVGANGSVREYMAVPRAASWAANAPADHVVIEPVRKSGVIVGINNDMSIRFAQQRKPNGEIVTLSSTQITTDFLIVAQRVLDRNPAPIPPGHPTDSLPVERLSYEEKAPPVVIPSLAAC